MNQQNNAVKLYTLASSGEPSHVRYVGKTVMSLEARLTSHKSSAKTNTYHTANWLRKTLREGHEVVIELFYEATLDDWEKWEKHFIKRYRSEGHQLTNTAPGGEGGGSGENAGKAKLTNQEASEIRKRYRDGENSTILASDYGVRSNTIFQVVDNKTFHDPNYVRTRKGHVKGEEHGNSKIDWETVKIIRHMRDVQELDYPDIAARIGLAQGSVRKICRNEAWVDANYVPSEKMFNKKGAPPGEKKGSAKLTQKEVNEMRRKFLAGGQSGASLGREYGVSTPAANNICRNKMWKDAEYGEKLKKSGR